MLTLATPLRGRSIPFHFLTYSSRTFEDQPSSRNLEHFKAIQEIQQLIGSRPIVFDREFSYCGLLRSLVEADVKFVIRLNTGSNPPNFYYDDEQKRSLRLLVAPINKPRIYRQVYYMGEVCLNVVGIWGHGFKEPMWIMTNMEPETGLDLYYHRMKIEICFQDLKSLLHIDKVMNKSSAQQFLAQFHEGQEVRVFYNPKIPSDAVLSTQSGIAAYIALAVCVVLAVIGFYMLIV